jgi:hypothetical protein
LIVPKDFLVVLVDLDDLLDATVNIIRRLDGRIGGHRFVLVRRSSGDSYARLRAPKRRPAAPSGHRGEQNGRDMDATFELLEEQKVRYIGGRPFAKMKTTSRSGS